MEHSSTVIGVLLPQHYADASLDDESRRMLSELGHVIYNPNATAPMDEPLRTEVLHQATAVLTGWGNSLTDEDLDIAPNLRAVAHAMGTPHPVEAAKRRGLAVFNTPEAYVPAVAEHAVGLMLASLRRIAEVDRALHSSAAGGPVYWGTANVTDPDAPPTLELKGRTVGLLGFGRIAQRLTEMLQAFRTKVLVYDPYVETEQVQAFGAQQMDLPALLDRVDVLAPLLPGVNEARHLIDADKLARLQDGTLIVNVSRGWFIDQAALEKELVEKRLYAALDVFDPEPLPADSPLRSLENVILTSHMAGPTQSSAQRHVRQAIEALRQWFYSHQTPNKNEEG